MFESSRQKAFNILAIGTLGAASLVGCASSQSTPTPDSCKPNDSATWTSVPSNFNLLNIASELKVQPNSLARSGRFGTAICSGAISVDLIGTQRSQIVSVEGEGAPCLVVGTQEKPVPGMMATRILAVCFGTPA